MLLRYVFFRFFRNVLVSLGIFRMLLRYVLFCFFLCCSDMFFFAFFEMCWSACLGIFRMLLDMFFLTFFEMCWSACLGIFRMLLRYVFFRFFLKKRNMLVSLPRYFPYVVQICFFAFFEMYWSAVFSMFFAFKKKRNMLVSLPPYFAQICFCFHFFVKKKAKYLFISCELCYDLYPSEGCTGLTELKVRDRASAPNR
jgi:hypothetical protein